MSTNFLRRSPTSADERDERADTPRLPGYLGRNCTLIDYLKDELHYDNLYVLSQHLVEPYRKERIVTKLRQLSLRHRYFPNMYYRHSELGELIGFSAYPAEKQFVFGGFKTITVDQLYYARYESVLRYPFLPCLRFLDPYGESEYVPLEYIELFDPECA